MFAAKIITIIYVVLMIIVYVVSTIQIVSEGFKTLTSILFACTFVGLILVGLMHPLEWIYLIHLITYLITAPSINLLLTLFTLFNMDNINWGTRDQSIDKLGKSKVRL